MGRACQAESRIGLPGARRPGFTLIEVLLVLAIMALFAAVFIPGVNSILREIEARGPDQILSETVLAARGAALESGRTVILGFDGEQRRFVTTGAALSLEPLPAGVKLDLLPAARGTSVLLGGQLAETGGLRRLRFFPDGTCDPFRARLQAGNEAPRILQADPWTCALSPEAPPR